MARSAAVRGAAAGNGRYVVEMTERLADFVPDAVASDMPCGEQLYAGRAIGCIMVFGGSDLDNNGDCMIA